MYECSQQARVFVPVRPSQPSLMSVSKARNLPKSETPEGGITWVGSVLLSNIRPGGEGLSGTNTLAYYKH